LVAVPELPDLVHVERKLRQALIGRHVIGARTGDPTVLRLMLTAPFPEVLGGRVFTSIERRGHFICLFFDQDPALAVNCMLAGRFWLGPVGDARGARSAALELELEGGLALRYLDSKRMGKVYVVPRTRLGEVPQLGILGVEVFSEAFTLETFRKLASRRRDQVRQFLMDKSALASIGNAYADEILFAARLHPKTFMSKLSADELDRLYHAIGEVLARAVEEITRRDQPIDVKIRDFLAVRGRAGQACPACGTTLRAVRVGDGDACFCPQCQPATRPLFLDWRKLPER
jgi:formamidopyrimidine-DNA glycosylase